MNKSVVRTMRTWTRLLALFLFVPLAHGQFMGDRQAKLVVTKPIEFMNETRNVEAVGSAEAVQSIIPVSYTHLTLPTIYSV